jgi:hypothetical protein
MKTSLIPIFIYSVCSLCAFAQSPAPEITTRPIISVRTALNHLTVLEFGEPVTMAAAGSAAFHIERQQDKVLVEPKNSGSSTDLLVWTASRRFSFELEPAGEVSKMDVAIDLSAPKAKPVVPAEDQMQKIADTVMKQALLGAEPIDSTSVRPHSNVVVRVQQVFRTRSTVYIHYKIENHTAHPFRIVTPMVNELQVGHTPISLLGLSHTQLNDKISAKLKRTSSLALPVALAESNGIDVASHQEGQGVIAIRQDLQAPKVLELQFSSNVRATLVL